MVLETGEKFPLAASHAKPESISNSDISMRKQMVRGKLENSFTWVLSNSRNIIIIIIIIMIIIIIINSFPNLD